MDFIVGNTLVLCGVAASFAIELIGAYCQLSYWMCRRVTGLVPPGTTGRCSFRCFLTCPVYYVAFLLGEAFMMVDAALLLSSVVMIECIAAANYLLCAVLACSHGRGKAMHQATRRLPHLVRWAFRKRFERAHFGWIG